jgi:hypothetical protein
VPADDEEDPEPAVAGEDRSWLDSVIILVVAGVASAASYGQMLEVAVWAGEPLWIARAFPVVRHEALVTVRVRDPPLVVVAAGRS